MTPVWKEYLKRLDAKKDSADDDFVNSGYTTDSSDMIRPGLLPRNDDSTVSTSSTCDSKSVSFADPVGNDLVQSNVALTEEDTIAGSEPSFAAGDTPPNDELHSILVSDNRPDTGTTLTNKHTFSTTVRRQKPGIVSKS